MSKVMSGHSHLLPLGYPWNLQFIFYHVGHQFVDDIFTFIFVSENCSFLFHSNFTKICSQWPNHYLASIGSDNGLAPNKWWPSLVTYISVTRLQFNKASFLFVPSGDAIMSAMTSPILSVSIVYSAVCSGADQRKHQNFASLAFVRGIHHWPVNSPHNEGPVTRKMFPFDDVIMVFQDPSWDNITVSQSHATQKCQAFLAADPAITRCKADVSSFSYQNHIKACVDNIMVRTRPSSFYLLKYHWKSIFSMVPFFIIKHGPDACEPKERFLQEVHIFSNNASL